MKCGLEVSFEIFEDGSVTMGGEPDDGHIILGPEDTLDLRRHDVVELWTTLREVLKESKNARK
jgi:hypothetical protein